MNRPARLVTTSSSPVRCFVPETLEHRLLFSTWIDTSSKAAVAQLYNTTYQSSEGVPSGWNGNFDTGNPGTTSAAFKTAVLTRINYFRSMAGIDNVTGLDPTYSQKAQAAAFMSSANGNISHDPPANWQYRTPDAVEGSNNSNLALGTFGPSAVDAYMDDYDASNVAAGHRRYIMYPQTQQMGTGDIPSGVGHPPTNALWVFDGNFFAPRPATREQYIAWPNKGWVPAQVITPRWSFSYAGADFTQATVSVTRNGAAVGTTIKSNDANFGEKAIVFDLAGDVQLDAAYNVQVSNVKINNVAQNFSYAVTPFDPTAVVAPAPAVSSTSIGTAANGTQRSAVKQISFTFDRAVNVAAGALSLSLLNTGGSGTNDGAAPTNASAALLAPTSSNGGATWTFTFAANGTFTEASGSLKDGVYTFSLDASKVTAGGTPMSANYGQTFHRLFGDVNASKNVNNADYLAFRGTFGKAPADPAFDAAFDFTGDGSVNNADYIQFRNRFGKTFNY